MGRAEGLAKERHAPERETPNDGLHPCTDEVEAASAIATRMRRHIAAMKVSE